MKKWLKQQLKRAIHNESGSISMYILIFMVFFLPFAVWIGVHLPVKFELSQQLKQIVSNTADSMIVRLDQERLSQGKVEVDFDEAVEIGKEMMRKSLGLDENWQADNEGLLIYDKPIPFYAKEITSIYALKEEFGDTMENGEYVIPEDVGVYIYVLNNLPYGQSIKFKGLLAIEDSSAVVIVRANIPVGGGYASPGKATTVIHQTGVSEANIHTKGR